MATRPYGMFNNQSATNYVNKKGINELFEVKLLQQYRLKI